jgi:hypothetical protein
MNRIFLLIVVVSIIWVTSLGIQNSNYVNAQPSIEKSIQQFNKNLNSNINKQIQSNINNSSLESNNNNKNINNCDTGNNIAIQSQTNNNGKSTSTTQTSCNTSNSFNPSFNSVNLKGVIISSEYNPDKSIIVNSLSGNWSLKTDENGIKDFNSLFVKQPIFYLLTTNTTYNAIPLTENNILPHSKAGGMNSYVFNSTRPMILENQNPITTSYDLSNFRANSVNQQNSDITYVGLINVVKSVHSDNPKIADETNSFKDEPVHISILNERTLVINFDKQAVLFDEFKDIPLVGLVQ